MQTTSVMFIPSSRAGLLTKMMREREQELSKITRFKVRMQESGGIQLARLFSTDLAKGGHCKRDDCHPCEGSDKRSNCKQSSILYESRCKLCNPNLPSSSLGEQTERIGIYYGETSRTLYERSKEHVNDADSFTQGSHIVKHWMTSHADDQDKPDFIFRVLSSYKDCLSRQVAEAIRIHYTGDVLLNSKNEYNANHLSRVVVEENVFQRKKRERQEEVEEMEEKKRWEVFKANHKHQPKRRREDESVPEGWKPGQNKRLRRMSLETEVWDLAVWWRLAEGMCLRAGKLKRRICLDKARVLRMMETYNMDRILSETPAWWNMAMAWTGSDSTLVEEPS